MKTNAPMPPTSTPPKGIAKATAPAAMRRIRALKQGEAATFVLFDATAKTGNFEGSMRVRVECMDPFHERYRYGLYLESCDGELKWEPYENGGGWFVSYNEITEIPAMLAFYQVVANFEEGLLADGPQRLDTPPEVLFAHDLKRVLELGEGQTYRISRDGWGPILIPDTCLIEGKRYPVRTTSILVERTGETTFELVPMMVSGSAEGWEECDYGDRSGSNASNPHRLWTVNDEGLVEAALRQAIATAEHDAAERRYSSSLEMATWEITEAHLRAGTLSDKTKAAVARGELS